MVGSVSVTCRPATNGESPAVTRHPSWGRSWWHAPGRDPTGLLGEASSDTGTRCALAKDRRRPRGVSKARAELDEWCTQVAPSDALRKWYGHDPAKFEEFGSRYRTELHEPDRASALRHLGLMASHHRLTLLTATKHLDLSQAAI